MVPNLKGGREGGITLKASKTWDAEGNAVRSRGKKADDLQICQE